MILLTWFAKSDLILTLGLSPLSCHYTYFAGCGTNPLHSSSPAVEWEKVPKCVHDAQSLLVDPQAYSVDEDDTEAREFNQSIFVVGTGAPGINSFKVMLVSSTPLSYRLSYDLSDGSQGRRWAGRVYGIRRQLRRSSDSWGW